MSSTLTRRAPSGHVVTVDWSADKLSSEVVGVRFAGSNYGRAFQIGTRGFHDDACSQVLHSTTSRALKVGGSEVRLAQSDDGQSSIATLIGTYHELMTVFAGPSPTEDTIAGLFSVLQIADTSEGMVVQPSSATLLTQMNENVMLVNESFDSLDMPGPAHARAMLPKGRGARNRRGGEVWRSQLPGSRGRSGRDFSYTVGCPTGIGQVMPGPAKDDDSDILGFVDGLHLGWAKD